MASRPELIQMCQELDIDYEDLSIEEMTYSVKTTADSKLKRSYHVGLKDMSDTLLKFLTEEYDFHIRDEKGKEYDYNFKLKEDI